MATVARLTIQIDADTASATARLTALNQRLQRLGDDANGTAGNINRLDDSIRRLVGSGNNANNSINRVNQGMRSGTRSSNGFQNAIDKVTGKGLHLDITLELIYLALIALSPVIYTAVGALGALASMLTVAAVGVGAFGLAVFATQKSLSKLLLKPLEKDFKAWGKTLESTMKPVYIAWADALVGKLKLLNPSVNIMADYMTKAGKAMGSFLGGNQFKSWLDDVNGSMKTIMPNLGSFLGDFLVGFLELMRAFLPLAEKMSAKLRDMGASFRNWAENLDSNKSFQAFIKDMEDMGPKVWESLKRVSAAIWSLIQNLSPLGVEILELVAAFSRFVAEADPEHVKKLAMALLGLMVVGRVTSLVNSMVVAFSSAGAMINPVTAVILAVIAGFIMAYNHSAKLRDRVEGLKEAFGRLLSALEPFGPIAQKIFEGFRAYVTFWAETCVLAWTVVLNVMAGFFEWVVPAAKTAWEAVSNAVITALNWIVNTFNTAKNAIVDAWNATWGFLAPKVEAVWNFIVGVVKWAWNMIVTSFNIGKTVVLAVWNALWFVLSNVVKGVFAVIAGIIMAAWWVISGIFDVWYTVISTGWKILWEILVTVVVIVWETIKMVVEVGMQLLYTIMAFFIGLIHGVWEVTWNTVMAVLKGVWSWIGPYVKGAIAGVVGSVTTAWNGIRRITEIAWSAIETMITIVWDFISNLIEGVTNYIKNIISNAWKDTSDTTSEYWNAIWNVIKLVWDYIMNLITGMTNWVKRTIVNAWNTVRTTTENTWNGIKDRIKAITDGIIRGIRAFREDAVGSIRSLKDRVLGVFKGAANWLYNAGRDVIRGLVNGIKSMAGQAARAATEAVKGAINGAKKLLRIKSPSKVFFEIGAWTTEGFANGITNKIPMASASVEHLVNRSIGLMPGPTALGPSSPQSTTATAQSGGDTYHFHFEGAIITGGEKQIENMVVNAVREASRKGRLRTVTDSRI